jgi:integrase/recombinase XerD
MATAKIELFKGKKHTDGCHPIMLRLSHQSKNRYIHLGASAKPEQWVGEEGNWVSKNYRGFKRLNIKIDNALLKAKNIIYDLDENNSYFTLDEIVKKYGKDKNTTKFFVYTEEIMKDLKEAKKIGNSAVYQTTLNVVKEFVGNKDFPIASIDEQWLKDFENYKLSKDVSVNGISNYLRTIRAIYNDAIKNKFVDRASYPFGRDGFKIKNSPTKKRAISADNMRIIRNLELDFQTPIWHARNYFMFSFFARGMSWVDMAHLKVSDIADGRIHYIRKKTMRKSSKEFNIKINAPIQEILNYYSPNKTKEDYVFPIIRRSEFIEDSRKDIKNGIKSFNKYLKRIADLTGIESNLTSYVSRHSWGTIAKKKGIDINVISGGYGHSDPSVTRTYLDDIEDEEIDNANDIIIQ